MSIRMNTFNFLIAAALLFLAAQRPSLAGSATWDQNPTSGDWNAAANWTPQTVPKWHDGHRDLRHIEPNEHF
jgi:hypothetical protein